MSNPLTDPQDERVVILAPIGRDAPLIRDVLLGVGVIAEVCETVADLSRIIRLGAGAVIVTEEVLHGEGLKACVDSVNSQPSWSDIPMIVLTIRDLLAQSDAVVAEKMRPLGHVTLLERPLRVATLVSITQAALRSRHRQYEVREHLNELKRAGQDIRMANEQLAAARDAALEANRLKSRFLANMSHELRTPLNAVLGYAEMIRDDADEDENETLSADICRVIEASRHLLMLITDVLDLAKVEAGRLTLIEEPCEIASLLQGVAEIVTPLVGRNGNTLTLNWPDDLGIMITDEARVRQCLLNLLSNAAKFTEKGSIELGARRCEEGDGDGDGDGAYIEFWVRDTGVGIAPDDILRLFTEFVQLDSSPTRRHGGTGLGLVLTRSFCELMGGSLSVESEPGKGSTFIIRLPQ